MKERKKEKKRFQLEILFVHTHFFLRTKHTYFTHSEKKRTVMILYVCQIFVNSFIRESNSVCCQTFF